MAADYHEEGIKNLIWHLKYSGVRDIGQLLSQILADYLVARDLVEYFQSGAVIPVPLHRKRERERSYNQAAMLAENLAKRLGLELLPALKRVRDTESQVDLPRDKRFENVAGAFEAAPTASLGERKILLIDDVATTGATLSECAKVLRAQGAGEIWGLVVARN